VIDFDALVLKPVLDQFARPVVITPTVSQPTVAPYTRRGSHHKRVVDVPMEDGSIMSSVADTIGFRYAEWPALPPLQGDRLFMPAFQSHPALGPYMVDHVTKDSEGGGLITIKKVDQ
jgi:hypothetical protein